MSPSRSALVAVVLLALASCTRRSDGRVPDSAEPPKAAFQVYPAEEVAGVKDPHDYKGKALCQRCHFPDLKLIAGPNEVCTACHAFGPGSHPVNVVHKAAVKDLPLLAGGKVACHTCHDPHHNKSALRKPFNELCVMCHGPHD